MKKYEQNLKDTWVIIKEINKCFEKVPEGEDIEKGTERTFKELMVKNFPHFMKDINLNIKETQKTPSMIKQKKIHTEIH